MFRLGGPYGWLVLPEKTFCEIGDTRSGDGEKETEGEGGGKRGGGKKRRKKGREVGGKEKGRKRREGENERRCVGDYKYKILVVFFVGSCIFI